MARQREVFGIVLLYVILVAGLFYFPRIVPERSLELGLTVLEARIEVTNSSSILHVKVDVENTHWETATWKGTFIRVMEATVLGRAKLTVPFWLNSSESGGIRVEHSQKAENQTSVQLDRIYTAEQNVSRVIVVNIRFSLYVLVRVLEQDQIISSQPMEIEVKDNVSPQIKWISPSNASYVTGQFTFKANYTDSGFGVNLSDVSLNVDGTKVGSTNGTYLLASDHFDFTPYRQLVDGNHSATLALTDYQGNKAKTYVKFTVDSTSPTVLISYPNPNVNVSGVVAINGTAQDAISGVRRVDIRIDKGIWKLATGTLNWRYSWNATTLTGVHMIEVRSTDRAGLQSTVVSLNVTVTPKVPS